MKLSECNANQKKAFLNIKNAAGWFIGGLENTLLDYSESDEEYIRAKETLEDHDYLVSEVYNMAITEVCHEGACFFGKESERYLNDIRFCGKDWLMERCDARVKKLGY